MDNKGLTKYPKQLEALIATDDYVQLRNNIAAAIKECKGVMVFNEADVDKAGLYISKFSGLKKGLEKLRKTLTESLNKDVKAINGFFKTITENIDTEETRLRKECNEVLAEIERKRKAIAAIEQKELEDAIINEAEMFNDESVLDNIPKIEFKHSKPESNHVTSVRVKKWRVVDFDKIDRKYLVVDAEMMDRLRKESDYDVTSQPIEGIEFYSEMNVRVK